jgi:hypothetical protein
MYAYTTCTCMIKQNVRFKFVYMYMKTTEFENAKHIFCTNNRNEISKPVMILQEAENWFYRKHN